MTRIEYEFLMMIEPPLSAYTPEPIEDRITDSARAVWKACEAEPDNRKWYRGTHRAHCGAQSDQKDHWTPMGRVTHSLMVHYVAHYRSAIPAYELFKLGQEHGCLFHKARVDPPQRIRDPNQAQAIIQKEADAGVLWALRQAEKYIGSNAHGESDHDDSNAK